MTTLLKDDMDKTADVALLREANLRAAWRARWAMLFDGRMTTAQYLQLAAACKEVWGEQWMKAVER
jgi:hypothetical protein